MKNLRRISILLMALVLLMTQALLIPASAAKETEDYVLLNDPSDFAYMINPDGTLKINLCWIPSGEKDIHIEIPESINGRKVTAISDSEFLDLPNPDYRLKSVIIPDSVTTIGNYTFLGCAGLTSITIPNGVTSIGDQAFMGCTGLTSITIPDSVTSIGTEAFSGCTALASITIQDGVTSIGKNAFASTAYYANAGNRNEQGMLFVGHHLIDVKNPQGSVLVIPEGTKTISPRAFASLDRITGVTIPNSVTSIGAEAFYHCSGLTNVTIPNGVTSIGDGAFSYCYALENITIPDSVKYIGADVLIKTAYYQNEGNWDQSGVLYAGNHLIAAKETLSGGFAIKEGTKSIALHALSSCTGLTSIDIPNGVTCIEAGAFAGLTNLRSVTIPNSVTSIEDEAFSKCSALEEITIPDGVKSIGHMAFANCSSLRSIVLPDSVTSIGVSSFGGCKKVKSLTLSTGLTGIPDSAFSGCGFTSVVIPGNVKSICDGAFMGCAALENITLLDGVEVIDREAFVDGNATSITIPNSVKSISGSAFWSWDEISRTVYYVGTPEQWSQMNVESKEILNANRIYLTEYESSGVKVTAPVGTVDAQAEFRAVPTDIGNIQLVLMDGFDLSTAVAYDLFFEKNGTRVQPNGAVTVSIPVPAELNNKKVKVFYADANGNLTDMNAQFIYGSMIFTTDHFSTYIAMEESKYSVSTDKPAYKADEAITVTVKAPDTVQKVYLTSETGTGLVSTRTKVDNGDGTATWTLTLSLGTIGERVLSVFADGEDTGADAELEIVYPAASGKVEVISAVSPAEVKANEPFTVTITTNSYAKNVRLFNENGAGLVPSECTCVKQGDDLVWTYTVAVGTVGQRTFMAKAAAEDNVYIGKKLVLLSVG